jgi:hypothetical protein
MESPQTDGPNHERWIGPRKIERDRYDFHSQMAMLAGGVADRILNRPPYTKDQWDRAEPDEYELTTLRYTLALDEAIQASLGGGKRGTGGMPLTLRERYDLLGAYFVIDRLFPLTSDERQELRQTVGTPTDPSEASAVWATERDRALWDKWDYGWWQGHAGLAGYKNARSMTIDVIAEASQRIAEVLETVLSD